MHLHMDKIVSTGSKKKGCVKMSFFDSLNKSIDDKVKAIARRATDDGLVNQIKTLQQKIEDDEDVAASERTLEILKAEADRRGLYY